MSIYFNPLDRQCKNITGGICQNQEINLKIFEDDCTIEPCFLVLNKDGGEAQSLPMKRVPDGWMINFKIREIGLYFYHFKLGNRIAGCGAFRNIEFQPDDSVTPYQILIYQDGFCTPDWFKGGIMYQIFPDRFNKSGEISVSEGKWLHDNWNEQPDFRPNADGKIVNNDFFGGNIQGIIDKLDYLKSLHITVLYLNPIFEAYSNHRYDTGDYLKIDPLLGTEKDFSRLVDECASRGIKIMLDGVFNHTGDDSRYFNKYGKYDELGAYQSKDSKYYDWYNFRNYPSEYSSWWGIKTLPAVNESSKSYIEFVTGENGVLRHWMKYKIAGFRLDVADELPDDFIQKIHNAVKESDSEAIVLGEVWEDASNKIAYSKRRSYFQGNELDSVMNYPLKNAIINFVTSENTKELREVLAMLRDNYPKQVLDCLMNILGTHDTTRILTALSPSVDYNKTKEEMSVSKLNVAERTVAVQRLKSAILLQFTLPGIPCIYYGDEIGMEGYADPFCRCPFAWDNFDNEIFSFYQSLTRIRSKYKLFKDSDYHEIFADDHCLVFERKTDTEIIVVGVNFGNYKYNLTFNGVLYEIFSSTRVSDRFTIMPKSFYLFSNKPD